MKSFAVIAAMSLAACSNTPHAQQVTSASSIPASAPTQPPLSSTPASQGLSDLERMTFDCPRAGLNAAAREASKAPSQGTYQFSYFNIIHDAHHALYEVRFKSNYQGEPELKYCVSMYCQQGWDPSTGKVEVTLQSNERKRRGHEAACTAHASKAR